MQARHIVILDIMYICNLIKIPTTNYVNATLKIWGHDFLRISGGDIQTFEPMGKSQMSKGEPIKTVNYLSCLIHPIIYYYKKLVELVIA